MNPLNFERELRRNVFFENNGYYSILKTDPFIFLCRYFSLQDPQNSISQSELVECIFRIEELLMKMVIDPEVPSIVEQSYLYLNYSLPQESTALNQPMNILDSIEFEGTRIAYALSMGMHYILIAALLGYIIGRHFDLGAQGAVIGATLMLYVIWNTLTNNPGFSASIKQSIHFRNLFTQALNNPLDNIIQKLHNDNNAINKIDFIHLLRARNKHLSSAVSTMIMHHNFEKAKNGRPLDDPRVINHKSDNLLDYYQRSTLFLPSLRLKRN